jgi:DNA-binding GntR family transcriptional regulator
MPFGPRSRALLPRRGLKPEDFYFDSHRVLFRQMVDDAAAGDRDALIGHDEDFHRALYEAGGRPERARRIVDLWESTRRAIPLGYRAWEPLELAIAAHRPILEAIEERDARGAMQRSRTHSEQGATRILR